MPLVKAICKRCRTEFDPDTGAFQWGWDCNKRWEAGTVFCPRSEVVERSVSEPLPASCPYAAEHAVSQCS